MSVPYRFLFPAIMAFCICGVYASSLNTAEVWLISAFGLMGYILYRLQFDPAPLLMGFVLGPLLEEQLRRALIISQGDAMVFLQRPISAGLLAVAAGIEVKRRQSASIATWAARTTDTQPSTTGTLIHSVAVTATMATRRGIA